MAARLQRFLLQIFMGVSLLGAALAGESPPTRGANFVSLADVAPAIIIEMRYFGAHNFIGRPVRGYQANSCLLIKDAALALARVQQALAKHSLGLKVYDCYRPQAAVAEFMTWARDETATQMKLEFYPNEKKTDLIPKGYIATPSGHSRGDTVDLTLVRLPPAPQPPFDVLKQQNCTADTTARYADNSLDMGTGYDCFDERSHTLHPDIGEEQRRNRLLLKDVMTRHGFRNYAKEWWHFTYIRPYGDKRFYDFPIQ